MRERIWRNEDTLTIIYLQDHPPLIKNRYKRDHGPKSRVTVRTLPRLQRCSRIKGAAGVLNRCSYLNCTPLNHMCCRIRSRLQLNSIDYVWNSRCSGEWMGWFRYQVYNSLITGVFIIKYFTHTSLFSEKHDTRGSTVSSGAKKATNDDDGYISQRPIENLSVILICPSHDHYIKIVSTKKKTIVARLSIVNLVFGSIT